MYEWGGIIFVLAIYLLVPILVVAGIVSLVIYLTRKKSDENGKGIVKSKKINFGIGFALYVMTILFAEQIVNLLFPTGSDSFNFDSENGSDYFNVLARLFIDTGIIAAGLYIPQKYVANVILLAGVTRFIIVFFKTISGGEMDPTLRLISFVIVFIVLLFVGVKKFGKSLQENK
jgi:uncharacterized membrane protein